MLISAAHTPALFNQPDWFRTIAWEINKKFRAKINCAVYGLKVKSVKLQHSHRSKPYIFWRNWPIARIKKEILVLLTATPKIRDSSQPRKTLKRIKRTARATVIRIHLISMNQNGLSCRKTWVSCTKTAITECGPESCGIFGNPKLCKISWIENRYSKSRKLWRTS